MGEKTKIKKRNRYKPIKKWDHNDETAIINYLKNNRDYEKPTARQYYSKFLEEYGIDVYWKLVFYKVRNMRTVYRRAKEFQVNKGGDANDKDNLMSKICWYVDDFDLLFPNEMANNVRPNSKVTSSDNESGEELKQETFSKPIFNNNNINNNNESDEGLKQETFSNKPTYSKDNNEHNSTTNEQFLPEEPTMFYFPKSIERDILAVQTGIFNFKRQEINEDTNIKQQKLNLAKDKFKFEQEKFRLEIEFKQKELEIQEKLKLMELQMKERIAMKEIELKERQAQNSTEKSQRSYNNVYNNML